MGAKDGVAVAVGMPDGVPVGVQPGVPERVFAGVDDGAVDALWVQGMALVGTMPTPRPLPAYPREE